MRSAAYSLLTSLLLLVPISAVPLMAIFGVPQFTPVVASPLDESEEDEWDRPSRKPARPKKPQDGFADDDLDLIAEESLSWDEPPKERLKPIKKPRSPSRADETEAADDLATAASPFDEQPGKSKNRSALGKPRRPLPTEEASIVGDDQEEISDFMMVTDQTTEDEPSGVDNAGFSRTAEDRNSEESSKLAATIPPNGIPSYRRTRSGNAVEADRTPEKSANSKRGAPAGETLTWSKAVERLNDLGIRNFKLEPGMQAGEFTFTCSYTPTKSPHVTRKFEADADDPLKAVAQVLSQVERWAQQREPAPPKRTADKSWDREVN